MSLINQDPEHYHDILEKRLQEATQNLKAGKF